VKEADGIILEYKPVQSNGRYYHISLVSSLRGDIRSEAREDLFTLEMETRHTIRELAGHNSYDVELEILSGSFMKGGRESAAPGMGRIYHVTMEKNGVISGAPPDFPLAQHLLPCRVVRPGDCWRGTCRLSSPLQERLLSTLVVPGELSEYLFTFDSLIKVGELECARILAQAPPQVTALPSGDEQRMSQRGKVYFACPEGALIGVYLETLHQVSKGGTISEISTISRIDSGYK
jgi:hypothetical protein